MAFVIFMIIVFATIFCLIAYYIIASDRKFISIDSSTPEVNKIRYIGGGYGTVANDRESAERLICDALSENGEVGVCQYIQGNGLKTLIGICRIDENNVKNVSFVD